MDGREIEHVEAHVADIGQPADDVVEGAVTAGIVGGGARKQFVPGAEAGGAALDQHGQLAGVERQVGAHAGARHQRCSLGRHQHVQTAGIVRRRIAPAEKRAERGPVVRRRPLVLPGLRRLDQLPALGQFQRQRQAGGVFLGDFAPPRGEEIAPRNQREAIAADRVERGDAAPAVVVDDAHRHFAPVLAIGGAHEECGGDGVMAVGEDVRLDDEGLANQSLGVEAAGIDFRGNRLDGDAIGGKGQQRLGGGRNSMNRGPFGLGHLRTSFSDLRFRHAACSPNPMHAIKGAGRINLPDRPFARCFSGIPRYPWQIANRSGESPPAPFCDHTRTMNPNTPYQFPPTRRVEDIPLVRGEGRFSDDLTIDGQLAAVFVRSSHAHASIRVDTAEALAQPGVVAVLTAADMEAAGVGSVSRPPPQTGRDGRPLIVPHRPALAAGRVVHVGEPIALVVAETLAAARAAADLVAVDYDERPAVTGATTALAPGAPQIWPEAPGNLAIDWVHPAIAADERDAVQRIIASAPHVVRVRAVNQRLAGVPLETRGATATFDAAAAHYTLHTPSQSAHSLKAGICAVMGLDPAELRVLSADVGGAFGLKTPPHPEHAALLVAARLTGRAVHWMATRSEGFLADHQGRDNVSEATLALDADGRFLALDVEAVTDLGAYVVSSGAIIATMGFGNCFPTMYDIPHVAVGVRLAFTNTVPTGAYRGAGRPEANYVMERVVEAAARAAGDRPARAPPAQSHSVRRDTLPLRQRPDL